MEIPECRWGRKKQVLGGAVLAPVGASCYRACHPHDVGEVLNFYHKRVWLEEQNRDVKTVFKGRGMRLLRAIRFEHLGGLRGLALAMPQKNSLSKSVSLDAIKMAEKGMVQKGGDLA